jgi:hypothetical protein
MGVVMRVRLWVVRVRVTARCSADCRHLTEGWSVVHDFSVGDAADQKLKHRLQLLRM